jgi:hypothetical protein
MKIKYYSKRVDALLVLISEKETEIESVNEELLKAIKSGADLKTVEDLSTKRNVLNIALMNLERQTENVSQGKNQLGEELVEYSSRGIDIDYEL